MAKDKKPSTTLSKQVKGILKTTESESSNDSKLNIHQLRKKLKTKNLISAEEIAKSCFNKHPVKSLNKENENQQAEVLNVLKKSPSCSSASKKRKRLSGEKQSCALVVKKLYQPNDEKPYCFSEVGNQMPSGEVPSSSLIQKSHKMAISDDEYSSGGDDLSTEEEDDQLYGEHCKTDVMLPIGNNVFCKKRVLDMAICTSHFASQLSRQLLEGVFTLPTLLSSTLTGKPPRAQGIERQNEPVKALNFEARMAIVEFSMQKAEVRKWTPQKSDVIEKAMSQKIGEIKRLHKKGLLVIT